jgi:hypothetical protein
MTEEKINISGILANRAMIVKLSTSSWGGRKADKSATKELLEIKRAEKKAGSVTKALIDKDHPTLKSIREIIRSMKSYHNTKTLPWDNEGGRLLPSNMHAEYAKFFRTSQEQLEEAVNNFVAEYPNLVNEASYMLGDLYDSDDYPHYSEIAQKFSLDVEFLPVPTGADFRVDIPKHEQEKIVKGIEERVEQQHATAMKHTWQRIFKTVQHMWERLADTDKVFRNTLVQNLTDLVDILPNLNILGDTHLEKMTDELRSTLCFHSPEDLRKDPELRKDTADKAREILDKISIFADMQVEEHKNTQQTDDSQDTTNAGVDQDSNETDNAPDAGNVDDIEQEAAA